MSLGQARTPTTRRPRSSRHTGTHLHGRWLVLARTACLLAALLAIGLFIVGLFARADQFSDLSTFGLPVGWTADSLRAAQAQLHLPVGFYRVYRVTLDLVNGWCFFLVAALIFWRQSTERMALFVTFFLFTFGAIWTLPSDWLVVKYPEWSWLLRVLEQFSWLCFFAFFFLFPDGHFVPRRMRWLTLGLTGAFLLSSLLVPLPQVFNIPVFLATLGTICSAQLYRYLRVADAVQRQQIKWVVFGFGSSLSLILLFVLVEAIFPGLVRPDGTGLFYELMIDFLGTMLFVPIPLSIGLAILRYRLWDIDIIIQRTLVYGTLTAMVTLVYIGLIFALQLLLRGLISQTNDVALVVSTLVVAALFQPLRRRIQQVIDRRFYRRKYDAAKTLEAFSATLRNEVDLQQLSEQLVAVVEETMQPTHVSLWLRPPEPSRKRKTRQLVRIDEEESE
jgi:hypothetical protein